MGMTELGEGLIFWIPFFWNSGFYEATRCHGAFVFLVKRLCLHHHSIETTTVMLNDAVLSTEVPLRHEPGANPSIHTVVYRPDQIKRKHGSLL
uniref:Uncharacterized protein n=1 Tax=Peronospora matthiolae TaxID=2874970 RepID=A0AAV1U494_9STRA